MFMFDDIANNELNPRPGVIINSPQGQDVYAGVPKVLDHIPYILCCKPADTHTLLLQFMFYVFVIS